LGLWVQGGARTLGTRKRAGADKRRSVWTSWEPGRGGNGRYEQGTRNSSKQAWKALNRGLDKRDKTMGGKNKSGIKKEGVGRGHGRPK